MFSEAAIDQHGEPSIQQQFSPRKVALTKPRWISLKVACLHRVSQLHVQARFLLRQQHLVSTWLDHPQCHLKLAKEDSVSVTVKVAQLVRPPSSADGYSSKRVSFW